MIALYFDATVPACPARSTTLLEFRCERVQFSRWQSKACNHRHAFTFASLSLSAHANGSGWRSFARCSFAADALGLGSATVRAALADASGVNDSSTISCTLASGLIHVTILVECKGITRSLHSLARLEL